MSVFQLGGNNRTPRAYLDTATYDYHGRINSHSRVINGRTTTMTINEFDQLDRPLWTDYNYPGSGQDEGILHRYDRHFDTRLFLMDTAPIPLANSLSYNYRRTLATLTTTVDTSL